MVGMEAEKTILTVKNSFEPITPACPAVALAKADAPTFHYSKCGAKRS
jgi:hypothetical protein